MPGDYRANSPLLSGILPGRGLLALDSRLVALGAHSSLLTLIGQQAALAMAVLSY